MSKYKILTILVVTLFVTSLTGCKKKSYCDKNGHQYTDATCTEEAKCSECGDVSSSALGHKFTVATCAKDSICERCNIVGEKAKGHTLITDKKIDATCNSTGLTEGSHCSICNEIIIKQEVIDKTTHDYTIATCLVASTCKNCGDVQGDKANHKWVDSSFDSPKHCSTCNLVELNATLYKTYLSIGTSTNIFLDGYYDLTEFNVTIDNPNVLEIDEYGTIKALDRGITNFSISLKNGNSNTLTYEIEVISPMPDIFVTYEKLAIGNSTKIFFRNLDKLDEISLNDFNITFNKTDILKLNEDFSITALKLGNDIVTITSKADERIKATINISVVDENSQLIITGKDALNSLQAGDQFFMEPNLNFERTDLEWLSTDETVAVVSADGLVSIVSEGYVTISAFDPANPRDNNKKAKYSFYIEGVMNIDYVSRLIHTALLENGTKEEGSNYQKYGEWYGNNGQPWCAMFVSWCWNRSGLSTDLLLKYQGCTAGMKWCTEQGIMHYVQDFDWGTDLENGYSRYQYGTDYKPVAGDIIFFLSAGMGHTGIAIYSDDTYLYTIEGNTSDQVAIKRWTLTDARITGYATPKYPIYEGIPEDFSWIKEMQPDGKYLWTNVSAQQKVD